MRRSTFSVAARSGGLIGSPRPAEAREACFEHLERRLVLAFDPSTVPSLGDLESSSNPVALVETSLGNIYIELFSSDAPTFVANFVNYLESGRWSDSLFHRRSTVQSSGLAVLQGGGYHYTDSGGLSSVDTFDPVPDQIAPGRPHLERTIAFAKAGPNTATSQFFINLEDNSGLQFLITDRFTVFGRIADNASWGVVQAIAALPTSDIRNDPNFGTNPARGAFSEAPLRGTYDPIEGFSEDNGAYIVAVTMAKPQNVFNFFETRLVFPDGYRGPGISTTVELGNTNDFDVSYQVVLRYQSGTARDQTLTTGTVAPNATLALRLFEAGSGPSEVRPLVPYSIEVWSTPRLGGTGDAISTPDGSPFVPLIASMRHRDFGGNVSEQFFNATLAGATQQQWLLPRVEVDAQTRDSFIVFQNLSDQSTTVTIEILGENGVIRTIQRDTGALRRGGIRLSNFSIADGIYAVRVSADQPLVAAATQYQLVGGAKPTTTSGVPAWNAMGTAGTGALRGYSSIVQIPSNGTALLDVAQAPGNTGSVVTLEATLTDGTVITSNTVTVLTASGGHRQINLRSAFPVQSVPADVPFTLRVNGSTPVASQTTVFFNDASEVVASDVPSRIGREAHFSNGLLPGGGGVGVDDIIAIFNPFRASSGVEFRYQVEFRFSDGTLVTTGLQPLDDLSRISLSIASDALFADVRTKVQSNPTQFSRYSITVLGFDASSTTPQAVPVAAQLLRVGPNTQTIMSNPLYFGGIVPFTNAQFTSGNLT